VFGKPLVIPPGGLNAKQNTFRPLLRFVPEQAVQWVSHTPSTAHPVSSGAMRADRYTKRRSQSMRVHSVTVNTAIQTLQRWIEQLAAVQILHCCFM
jgi:hypothetical protein